jgi:hypothetical protein
MADHDQLFKQLLRTFFPNFLGLVCPKLPPIVSPEGVRFLEQELFAHWPTGRKLEVDLLARIEENPAGEVAAFLVHVEIESRFRASSPRRLRAYFYALKGRYDDPILSILVSLRGGPPGISSQVLEEQFGGQCQRFSYASFGLRGCGAPDYLARPEPLAWALAALMRHSGAGRPQLKLECLQRISRASLSGAETLVLVNCVETYLELTPEETAAFARLQSLDTNGEVSAVQETWADRMRAEGMQKGMEKGQELGLEKGRQDGARQLLVALLVQRFGELPGACRRRIAAIRSLDRLTGLAQQVLTARSLAELGLA